MKDWSTLDFNIFLYGESWIGSKDACGIERDLLHSSCSYAFLYRECFFLQIEYCKAISWLKLRAMNHNDSFIVHGQYCSTLAFKKKWKIKLIYTRKLLAIGEVLEKLHGKISYKMNVKCFSIRHLNLYSTDDFQVYNK